MAADGFVSIEVSPDAARDADSTREQVRRLWDAVDRPNLMVKIPGTDEGVAGHRGDAGRGEQHQHHPPLLDRRLRARRPRLHRGAGEAPGGGQPIDRIASVASFFVSRVDTLVDKLLDEKIAAAGDADEAGLAALKGKIAVANAKLAYAAFQETLLRRRAGTKLAAAGARVQRPLWASTGTKNPAYSDTLYVDTLIGPDTVNTMPGKTIDAFLDHGTVARTVDEDFEGACEQDRRDLAAAGIDIDAVTEQLEEEGIASFVKSFETLLAGVESKRAALAVSR